MLTKKGYTIAVSSNKKTQNRSFKISFNVAVFRIPFTFFAFNS